MTANPEEMTSTDPDGFGCYSDHAEDIRTHGECAMCTSTDPEVVGHVLPGTQRLTGIDPVVAAKRVVAWQSMKFVDGVLLDLQTAHVISTVYDALSEPNQQKLRAMSLTKAAAVCWKLTQPRR